jgi:hypothetical protein
MAERVRSSSPLVALVRVTVFIGSGHSLSNIPGGMEIEGRNGFPSQRYDSMAYGKAYRGTRHTVTADEHGGAA